MKTPRFATLSAILQAVGFTSGVMALQHLILRRDPRWRNHAVPTIATAAVMFPYAIAVRKHAPYSFSRRGLWLWLVDSTWSAPNTFAGALFYEIERLRGNKPDFGQSQGSGTVWLEDQAIVGYATTVGIVKAGSTRDVDAHENIHVFQARLFGPFYLPLVAGHYVVATLFPYWLVGYLKTNPPIRDIHTYFHRGVYPSTWHERWAYTRTNACS